MAKRKYTNHNRIWGRTGPLTPEEIETIRAELERDRDRLEELDRLIRPAIEEDLFRWLDEVDEEPEDIPPPKGKEADGT